LQWFKSMYTLQGKPDKYVICIPHSVRVWHSYHLYLTQSAYSNLLRSWTDPLPPRRRDPDPIRSMTTDQSTGLYPASLPQQSVKQWGKIKFLLTTRYISLPSPYHRHAISTFNACSWVPNHQSLIDTDGGYNLRGADFSHHSPHPSQPMVLRFLTNCPVRPPITNTPQETSNILLYSNCLPLHLAQLSTYFYP
jgi:hypothetical protein